MGAYDDLIPEAGATRRRGPYDDLLPAVPPAGAEVSLPEAATAAAEGIPPGSLIGERVRGVIGASVTRPEQPLVLDPARPTASVIGDALRQRVTGKIAYPEVTPIGTTRPATITPDIASFGPDTTTPVGGGSRLDALRAIPGIAGDTVVQQVAGLGRLAGDVGRDVGVPGAETLGNRAASLAREAERSAAQRQAPFEPLVKNVGRRDIGQVPGDIADWFTAPSNIAQVGSQAPQLATSAAVLMGASPGAALLYTMGLPVLGQSYDQYREKGYDPPVALLGGLGQAATEVIPEMAWLKFARGTRLADLRGFTTMGSEERTAVVRGLLKGSGVIAGSELGQEEVSTIGNWVVDYAMRLPDATIERLGQDMKETVRQVAIAAPAMAGAAHVGHAVARPLTDEMARRDFERDRPGINEDQANAIRNQVTDLMGPGEAAPSAPAIPAKPAAVAEPAPAAAPEALGAYADLVPAAAAAPDPLGRVEPTLQGTQSPDEVMGMPAGGRDAGALLRQYFEYDRGDKTAKPVYVAMSPEGEVLTWSTSKRTATEDADTRNVEGARIERVTADNLDAIAPAAPKTEPWRMTRADYVASFAGQRVTKTASGGGQGRFNRLGTLQNAHSEAVDAALQLGKPVPAAVKAEYPDLVKKYNWDSGSSRGMPAASRSAPAGTTTAIAATVPGVPPQQAAARVSDKSRPDAIRAELAKLFGTVISEKGHRGLRTALGLYRINPQTIRVRNRNDLRTIAHEVGHHLSEKNKPFRMVMATHAAELIPMAPAAYHQAKTPHTRKFMTEEGFAEYFAEYISDRPVARTKAPGFTKAFEKWLATEPHYKDAIAQVSDAIAGHQGLGPADAILAKVGAYQPPWLERAGTLVSKDTWDSFVWHTLDRTDVVRRMVAELAPGVVPSQNPHIAMRLLPGDSAIIEDWLTSSTSPFDYQKRTDVRNYGKSLQEILTPIIEGGKEEIANFKSYLIAKRAAELKRAGKENLLTAAEINAGLALETQQPGRQRLFEATANMVYSYNDRLLDYAVEGGLLSPEVALKFKQYTAYIPFFREPEGDAKGGGKGGDPFKRLKGGTANLRDPFQNLIQNTANIIHATNRNAAVQKAVALASKVPGGGAWLETVPVPQQAHAIATQRIVDDLRKQGVQIDTSMATSMAAMQTFFMPSGRGDERTRTLVYKEGGELKAAQINDILLWKTLGNMAPLELGLIGKILAAPASTLRAGVVLDPSFMARNFIRDTLSATIQSKGAFIPGLSTAQGMKAMATKSDSYKLWRAFGGAYADQFREPQESAALITKMAKRGNFSPSSIITPTRWLDALKHVGAMTESGSRIGEFSATYKPGDFESALQAALNAREVSTDFSMKGGSTAIQIITRVTPFMNPAMQGLYKGGRTLSGMDGRAAAFKAAVIGSAMGLASILLALANADEDWYKAIEEWEKATYWHFKLGGEIWRIAKPFEYGGLFASIPEAIALLQQGKENWGDFRARMLQVLGQVFGFRVIPQALTIVAEPWANKSFFTGRKLVPDKNARLEPGLQAGPGTSKTAQVVGEAANVSPAVIDNLVRNVFGTLGVHATTAADVLLEKTGVVAEGREKSWRSWPAVKAFIHDPDNPNSKQMRDFYDELEKYRTALATVKQYKLAGEDVKAEGYAARKENELDQVKGAEAVAKRLAKIRRAVQGFERDRELSAPQKREYINAENAEAQDIVAEFELSRRAAEAARTKGAR